MADENIQCAAILHAVKKQTREHGEGSHISFRLGVLIDAVGAIADRTAEAADQELVVAHNFQVQVGAAIGMSLSERRSNCGSWLPGT